MEKYRDVLSVPGHYYTWTICIVAVKVMITIFVMSESAHNLVKYIVITVEFVITIYEEGSGNGV
jgi:hypothetical protein